MHTVRELESQRDSLCNLLERKDKEIEEHKMEGGEISRSKCSLINLAVASVSI